ncbi:MAG: C25 family cysteine peptidase, partial [Nitrospirota bacterium]|nr:C25 family cysteine peptidase [Nitrospirota bacterium]
IYFETTNSGVTYTPPAGYTETYDGNDPSNNFALTAAYKNISADGTENPTLTQSAATRYTLTAISLNPATTPTAVKLISFDAANYDGGVLLQWRTGHEVKNLGFNIYREAGGQLERVNSEIIAGSALVAGPKIAVSAGRPYTWLDDTADGKTSYYLEDIDLGGKRTMYGPVTAVAAKGQQTAFIEQSATLSGLSGMHTARRDKTLKLHSRLSSASKIRRAYVELNAGLPPEQVQWRLAGTPAVKIFIQEEGWYRITQPELVAYGLGSVDPRYLQLYVNGIQIPMVVNSEKDRYFDPQDSIEFYGMGLDTPSTDTQTYYLVAATKKGLRVKTVSGGTKVPEPSNFAFTVEARPRMLYAPALPKNDEGDKLYGPLVLSSATTVVSMDVQHPDPAASVKAVLDVSLQGLTYVQHSVSVMLNDSPVGQVVFSGQAKGRAALEINQSELKQGENLLQLKAQNGSMDLSFLDNVSLTYWHTYTADNDALRFTALGGGKITVSGFSASDIRVMDITDPNYVREVSPKVAVQGPAFAATFNVPSKGPRTLLAFNDNAILHPAAITSNNPSALHAGNNGADMVIIAHSSLVSAITPLKQFRESQGRRVAIIDVEDIYDEFSFGNKTPEAIQDFLYRASTAWTKKPRFLLLTGDATVDPRDYLGYGLSDLVPTNLVDGVYSEAASDDLFADFNEDGLPEMAVGRIPAGSSDEVQAVVSKIIGYELAAPDTWTKKAVVVSDNDPDIDFEGASDEIAAMLPADFVVKKVYRRDYASDTLASTDLMNSINAGALIVNYMGHGSEDTWGGNILVASDANSLTNGLKLPFFMNMTCWNGLFASPYVASLGE